MPKTFLNDNELRTSVHEVRTMRNTRSKQLSLSLCCITNAVLLYY